MVYWVFISGTAVKCGVNSKLNVQELGNISKEGLTYTKLWRDS